MRDDAAQAANVLERIGRLVRTGEQAAGLNPVQWAVMRYLSRANRFSRTPMALTLYLATTRGTMSQTIIALERKGYVSRKPSEMDRRSVNVVLTAKGREKLRSDPLLKLTRDIRSVLGPESKLFSGMLNELLLRIVKGSEGRMFGLCGTCRHFDEHGGSTHARPHRCGLLDIGLSDTDTDKICVEHELG